MTGKRHSIACLVGTRPECIKMAPVIKALRASNAADVTVISTGQHKEMVRQTLGAFSLKPDIDLDVMAPNQTLAGLSAAIFTRFDPVLAEGGFDLLLVQGDTTSVMVAALNAFYRKVPVAHVEGGLRTHDIALPFPEELNRVVAGRVAALHFAPTRRAHDNLVAEGVPQSTVMITGNTVIDALLEIAGRELPCAYPRLSGNRFVLVTAHRRESFGAPLQSICAALAELHQRYPDLEFVYPVHPNPNVKEPVTRELGTLERVHLIPPVDYTMLVSLMQNCHFILTDSGGIQEEAPALNKPVLVLREETERPEAVDVGVACLVGTDRRRIVETAARLMEDESFYATMAHGASPYGDGHAAERIAAACHDYLDGRLAEQAA